MNLLRPERRAHAWGAGAPAGLLSVQRTGLRSRDRRAGFLAGSVAGLVACVLASLVAYALAGARTAHAQVSQPSRDQSDSPADPVRARFDGATRWMAAGKHDQAAAELAALARDAPEHAAADDALFTAAQLYEEKLAQPARALEVYQQLISAYPDSRTALAAERRAEAIRAQLGPDGEGAEALARFTDVLQGFPRQPVSESIAEVEALVSQYPQWNGRPRALLWLAALYQRDGRLELALERYLGAAAATAELGQQDSEHAALAYRGAGDVSLARGDLAAAELYYQRMPVGDDPGRAQSFADAMAGVRRTRWRDCLYDAALVLIALVLLVLALSLRLVAGSAAIAWQALRRPPTEAIFMIPVAAVLIAASFTGHYAIGPAVTIVCAGGLILTWLSGAGLIAAAAHGARFARTRALVHALACALAVLALCYVALHRGHLIDMILDTVRFGPDS